MFSDLKSALRQIAKCPGLCAGVILILALAIGANTAEFSITRAVLLRPLPWPQADRLVYVYNTLPSIGWPLAPVAIPDYLDRRNQTDCFKNTAAFAPIIFNLATGPSPEQVTGLRVTPSFFPTLGVSPSIGRAFTADEAVPGREKVAIISYAMWQTQLGGRENAFGSDIRLNDEVYRVVGIMPKNFLSPGVGLSSIGMSNVDLWVPFAFTAQEMSDRERGDWESWMIARLRDGVSIEQAQQQVDAVQHRNALRLRMPDISRKDGGFGGVVVNYREQNTSRVRPMLLILQAAATLILLIACANVGNLLLARATARKKELAIRLALGCGRLRLARQLLTESFVLVLLGGSVGILAGHWGLELFGWLYRGLIPGNEGASIDRAVLGFTLLLSLGSGLFFGLVPLVSLWRHNPADSLRDGNARGSAGRSAGLTRAALIVTEVALALMLLIAAGLTLKSFAKLQEVSPGFTSDNVLTAQVSLPTIAYKDGASQSGFYAKALEQIRALPGVKSASAISCLPFSGMFNTGDYGIRGEPVRRDQAQPNARIEVIDPAYFRAMQIPLIRGRAFSAADTDKATPTVVIDEFLAHRYFAGRDPIGRQIRCSTYDPAIRWCTIVGIVGEIKTGNLAEPIDKETLYFPLAQRPLPMMTLVLKTELDPHSLVAPLRQTIQRIDPELPAYDIQTMNQRLADSLAGYRSPMSLLMLFGGAALTLATLGLYAVLAYSVSQRTRELGIRIALGAQGRAILGLVIGQGLRLTLLGVVLGLAASFALSRLLRSLLFGVSTNDPVIYLAVPALLFAVAIFACLFPARRASKVDPIVALRAE